MGFLSAYNKGDRVYVQVISRSDPSDASLIAERTEIPATVERMMVERDGQRLASALVIVTIDKDPRPGNRSRRDGYGFETYLVRPLDGEPRTILVWKERARELEAAIRKHRAARGHDRCWENDLELYAALHDGVEALPALPPHDEFMTKCEEYYECQRQHRDGRPS